MMNEAHLQCALGGTALSVRRFVLHEALSSLFTAEVTAVSPDPDLDLSAIVGQPARLDLHPSAGPPRGWSGVCLRAGQVRSESAAPGLSTYELTLVPDLFRLSMRRGNRLFQHRSIPDIALGLLREHRVGVAARLDPKRYPSLSLRVQYGEADLAFFQRLLEEAGISFWFEDTPGQGTTLILGDEPQASPPREAPLFFLDSPGQAQLIGVEYATDVRLAGATRTGRITLRDHDLRRPSFDLTASSTVAPAPEERYERYHHLPGAALREIGPGEPTSLADRTTPVADDQAVARHDLAFLEALAERRLAGERADRRTVTLTVAVVDLGPGSVFRLADHPHAHLSPTSPLLVRRTRFEGDVQDPWKMVVEAVFTEAPYRPPHVTPKPVIHGVQRATVVGPAGEEIHTDEFGRVRVQLPWDREGRHDPGSSPWIRVSQGWAGPGYGMVALPRVGQEVLIEFLDGDPDCPVVTGRLHNGEQLVPHPLPDHKAVSSWKTDSSPRKAPPEENGFHEIKFDDTRGAELFYVQSERDLARLVKRDSLSHVARDRTGIVGRDEHTSVERDHTESVQRDDRATIARDRDAQVRGDQAVVTGGHRTTVVHRDAAMTVGQDQVITVGADRRSVIGTHETTLAGARFSVAVAPGTPDRIAEGAAESRDETPLGRHLAPVASLLAGALATATEGTIGAVIGEATTGSLARTPLAAAIRAPLAVLSTLWPASIERVVEMVQAPLAALVSRAHVPGEVLPARAPTRIEMIERRITLTTRDATIELDGPNITVTSERDLTFVGHKKVVVNCQDGRLSVRGPAVHVNPDGGEEVAVDLAEAPEIYAGGGLQFEQGLLRLGHGGAFTLPEAARALAPAAVKTALHDLGTEVFLEAASLAGLAPGDRIGALAELAARIGRPLSFTHAGAVLAALYGGEPPGDLTSVVSLLGEGADPRSVPGKLNTALRGRLFDAFLGAADIPSALGAAARIAGQYTAGFATEAERGFDAARRPMEMLAAFARKAGGPDRPGPVAAFRTIAELKRSMLRLGLLGHMGFADIDAFDALANRAHDAMKIADSVELQGAIEEMRSLLAGTALLRQLAPPAIGEAAAQLLAFAQYTNQIGRGSPLDRLPFPAPADWAPLVEGAQALFTGRGAL